MGKNGDFFYFENRQFVPLSFHILFPHFCPSPNPNFGVSWGKMGLDPPHYWRKQIWFNFCISLWFYNLVLNLTQILIWLISLFCVWVFQKGGITDSDIVQILIMFANQCILQVICCKCKSLCVNKRCSCFFAKRPCTTEYCKCCSKRCFNREVNFTLWS